jgi:hypothetical protein
VSIKHRYFPRKLRERYVNSYNSVNILFSAKMRKVFPFNPKTARHSVPPFCHGGKINIPGMESLTLLKENVPLQEGRDHGEEKSCRDGSGGRGHDSAPRTICIGL